MYYLKCLLIFIPSFWLFAILFAYTFQITLVFNGRSLPKDYEFKFSLPHEEINLVAEDGTKINGVFIRSVADVGNLPQEDNFPTSESSDTLVTTRRVKDSKKSKGVVLYFHGNSSNLQWYGQYHRLFTTRGYDFFGIDYRSYGKSEGSPDSLSIHSDALMAYEYLRNSYAAEEIIIFGKSLGTAVATRLASKVKCRKLILETPYNQMRDVVATRIIPLWMPFPLKVPLENVHSLPQVKCPVVIFHGTKDEVIAYRLAEKLRAALKPNDTFITIEGAKHKDLEDFSEFQEGLDKYLK